MGRYNELLDILRDDATLFTINELLEWDMEVYMPSGQQSLRAKQNTLIESYKHDLMTSEKLGAILADLAVDTSLNDEQRFTVEKTFESYSREKRVSRELVEAWAKKTTDGYFIWEEAKEKNNFKAFAPILGEIFDLAKRIAEKKDPDKSPYGSVLYDYEEDLSLEQVTNTLASVRNGIVPIIKSVEPQELKYLKREVPAEQQREFNKYILGAINFNFEKGRLDEAVHPFTSAGRITTRYTDPWFENIGSTIHESGHAMYDHNLPEEHFGTPRGTYKSMAVHESQSRIWENHLGKNPAFWKAHFDFLKKSYSPALDDMDFDSFIKEIHHAEPSLIRVAADELTYPLHVIMRFELEQDLMSGKLKVNDLPDAWNAKMKDYLGLDVPNDAQGCMQDVHWSQGLIGYFPTYILGSIMSAQLYASAKSSIPNLEQQFEKGNTKPLAEWLNENIHQYGARYTTNALLFKATGAPLTPYYYISHLKERYGKK